MKRISLVIPCHNEEKGLIRVLSGIPRTRLKALGFTIDIIVVDNASTDNTAAVAKQHKARVIFEAKPGKGNAMIAGFRAVSKKTDYVVMMDGDGTYLASELLRMIEPLDSGFCHMVVGSRLGGKITKHSFLKRNRLVNWGFTFLVRSLYLANVTDVLSGYFAWKRPIIESILPYITSNGFALEMEMVTKIVKLGYQVYSVPITYEVRDGESKIKPLSDGLLILRELVRNLFWTPDSALKHHTRNILIMA
jgi:dolichol-phosphate mannosyltransferase